MRKCFSHLGHTFRFSSRSFFQIICRQLSHFTHKPSVRTVFLPEVSTSPDSRLNQAIGAVLSSRLPVLGNSLPAIFSVRTRNRELVFDPSLGHHAFLVSVLYLAHFGHGVGGLDNCGVCVPPRQDDMHHFRFPLQALYDSCRSQHAVTDRIIDLVQYHQIPFARVNPRPICFITNLSPKALTASSSP